MKRFVSIMIVITLVISFCVQTASTAIIGDVAREDSIVLSSVLTDSLRERLAQAADDDIIRVTIELMDDIDLDDVERKAVSHAEISLAEMAVLNAETYSLTDAENESLQLKALKIYDRISNERISILKEYYKVKNEEFISSTLLRDAKIGSVGLFTPFIQNISLTKKEIYEIAKHPTVCLIDCVDEKYIKDFDDINNTYKIVGGDAFINAGYSGSGIRVGLIEPMNPVLSVMGSDKNNITIVKSGTAGAHPTVVSGIIKKFAPSCSIYSYATGDGFLVDDVPDVCQYLIDNYSVHVINISAGVSGNGEYTAVSRQLDHIIRKSRVPIVVAAGNAETRENHLDDGEVEVEIINNNINILGLAGNVITVGNAKTVGIDPDATNAFTLSESSCYNERSPINKPDICAPGYVRIYNYSELSGTSFSTPHVTGTIVQMMARNAAFVGQPQKVKAALLASATRNCGTSMSYIDNTIGSNYEGAGVLDAEFCYRVSRTGRSTYFEATSSSGTFTQDVYCDYSTKPFRIACTWEVAATDKGTTVNISDYNLTIYKNGVQVASSTAFVSPTSSKGTNSEIIEIPASVLQKYGGGYYEVRISRNGSFNGSGAVKIGLAWEQD